MLFAFPDLKVQQGRPLFLSANKKGPRAKCPRSPFLRGGEAIVPLTQGKEARLDFEDVLVLGGKGWILMRGRRTFYAARRRADGETGNAKTVRLHRVIMKARPGEEVDHIDGDGLNCHRSNLRIATNPQNGWNRTRVLTSKRDQTLPVGVYWNKASKKFSASLCKLGKHIHLGLFKTQLEAAEARRKGAEIHFGAFAPRSSPD